jgi:flagellar biosynthesis component FlhA
LNRLTSPIVDAGDDPIVPALMRKLSSDAGLRLTMPTLERMLAAFIAGFPMPMFNAFEALGSVKVLRVLRSLAEEGVSIKDLRTILGALLEVRGTIELTRDELEGLFPTTARVIPRVMGERSSTWVEERSDYVRLRLRDQLCGRLADADGTLTVAPLSRKIEDQFAGPRRSITPREAWNLSQAILKSSSSPKDHGPVLLVSYSRRRAVRQAICRHIPAVQVVCTHELDGALITKRGPEIDYSFTS